MKSEDGSKVGLLCQNVRNTLLEKAGQWYGLSSGTPFSSRVLRLSSFVLLNYRETRKYIRSEQRRQCFTFEC